MRALKKHSAWLDWADVFSEPHWAPTWSTPWVVPTIFLVFCGWIPISWLFQDQWQLLVGILIPVNSVMSCSDYTAGDWWKRVSGATNDCCVLYRCGPWWKNEAPCAIVSSWGFRTVESFNKAVCHSWTDSGESEIRMKERFSILRETDLSAEVWHYWEARRQSCSIYCASQWWVDPWSSPNDVASVVSVSRCICTAPVLSDTGSGCVCFSPPHEMKQAWGSAG